MPHQPRLSHSKRQQNSAAWRHALAKYTALGWGELGCWICEAETTHLGAVKILKFQQAGYHIKNITSTLSPRESWSSKRNLDVLYNMLAKSRCIFLEFKWWFPVGYNNPTVTSHLQQSKKTVALPCLQNEWRTIWCLRMWGRLWPITFLWKVMLAPVFKPLPLVYSLQYMNKTSCSTNHGDWGKLLGWSVKLSKSPWSTHLQTEVNYQLFQAISVK